MRDGGSSCLRRRAYRISTTSGDSNEPPASDRLTEVAARVLIVEGEDDNPAYRAMTERLLTIPGAGREVIAGAGHLVNLDNPVGFDEAVEAFLRED
jgi:3-oxoadipate enol-lactonase